MRLFGQRKRPSAWLPEGCELQDGEVSQMVREGLYHTVQGIEKRMRLMHFDDIPPDLKEKAKRYHRAINALTKQAEEVSWNL